MPKVSVIIPVYNVESYLPRCLDSVINQTLKDIEIICVNDASTDGSIRILHDYALKDKRIVIVDLPQNRGAGNARNIGIEKSAGIYIGFIDSDDYIDLDFYEKLFLKAKSENAQVSKGTMSCIKNGEKDFHMEACYDMNKLIKQNRAYFYHSFTTAIYSNKFLSENNIRFPLYSNFEDPHFSIQVALKLKTICIVDNVNYYYNNHSNSSSKVVNKQTLEDTVRSVKSIINILKNQCSDKEFFKITYAYIFQYMQYYCEQNKSLKQEFEYIEKMYQDIIDKKELEEECIKQQKSITASKILKYARNKVHMKDVVYAK